MEKISKILLQHKELSCKIRKSIQKEKYKVFLEEDNRIFLQKLIMQIK